MIGWIRRASVFAMLGLAILVYSAAPAQAQSEGLTFLEDTVFTIEPDAILVESTFVFGNTTTDRQQGNTVYYTFFDHMAVPIPEGAVDVSAASRGRGLMTTAEPTAELDDFEMLSITFPSDLRAGESREVKVTYRLPAGGLRGNPLFTANPAFYAFPVWSSSDPETGSIEIRVPMGAETVTFGDPIRIVDTDAEVVTWEPVDFETPQEWFTYVTVRNDAALEDHSFTASGQKILLESWPGDDAWVDFATDTIRVGLPTLEALIGQPVPEQETLEITEAVTPYFYGYGGWYSPLETSIEVGNELDDSVMLHELSHAWFNDSLFTERWIDEGLAEEFTWRAERELDWGPLPEPQRPGRTAPGSQALVSWSSEVIGLGRNGFEEQEAWGYNASWWVVHEATEIVGLDGVQRAIAAADHRRIPYTGDGDPESFEGSYNWKRLLDLLAENAADPAADTKLVELFETYVVEAGDTSALADRALARSELGEFEASELGWATPLEVREAMSHWRFDDAATAIEAASMVQQRYAEVVAEAGDYGLVTSDAVRVLYEGDRHDLPGAHQIIIDQTNAIDRIVELRSVLAAERPWSQRWALGETDLNRYVKLAEAAFAEDRFGDIDAARAELDATLDEAADRGERNVKLAVGGGAAVLLALISSALWLRRRGKRKRAALLDIDRYIEPATDFLARDPS